MISENTVKNNTCNMVTKHGLTDERRHDCPWISAYKEVDS